MLILCGSLQEQDLNRGSEPGRAVGQSPDSQFLNFFYKEQAPVIRGLTFFTFYPTSTACTR